MNNTLRNVAAFCLTVEKPCFPYYSLPNYSQEYTLLTNLFIPTISLEYLSSLCLTDLLLASLPADCLPLDLMLWIVFYFLKLSLLDVKTLVPLQMQFSAEYRQFYSFFSIPAITSLWHSYLEKGRVVSYQEPGVRRWSLQLDASISDWGYKEIHFMLWAPVSSIYTMN